MYRRIGELAAEGGTVTLADLATERTRIAVARALLLVLFLNAQGRVMIWQDRPFGDIFISLHKPGD